MNIRTFRSENCIPELSRPDFAHFNAANGWLELGLPVEAAREVSDISAASQNQRDVLLLKCRIHLAGRNWVEAANVAKRLLTDVPAELQAWLTLADAVLHIEPEGPKAAIKCLLIAEKDFSSNWRYLLRLSRYAALAKDFRSARKWMRRSISLGCNGAALEAEGRYFQTLAEQLTQVANDREQHS